MRRLPQAMDANPAFQPLSNTFFNLPIISSIHASVNNSGFSYDDYNKNGRFSDLANQVWDFNSLKIRSSVDILRFGGRFFDTYHSLNITFKSKTFLSYPSDIIDLLAYGNYDFEKNIAKSYDLSQLRLTSYNYIEFAYTYSNRISKKLAIGYKAKLLKGLAYANIDFDGTEINTLSTNQTPIKGQEFKLRPKAELAGLPSYFQLRTVTSPDNSVDPTIESDHSNWENYGSAMATGNFGLGFDLGFTYKYKDNLEISASIADFGVFFWNELAQTVSLEGNLDWSGLKIPNDFSLDNVNFNEILNENIEKISTSARKEGFYSVLPFDVNFGIEYQKNDDAQWGGLMKLMYFNGTVQPQVSAYATYTLLKSLNLTTNYTIKNHSLMNLGVGVDLKLGFVQLYFLTDNISSILLQGETRGIGVHTGMNFIFRSYEKSLEEQITHF